MLIAILRDGQRRELARAGEPGNGAFLLHDDARYVHLSELSEVSFDTFAVKDMPALIDELLDVQRRRTDPHERQQIDEIIALARRTESIPGATLTFAPA